ncbi:hypothetical protein pdul_cds_162 [Pandoravirus dulcis]|uniref:Uncharacterized protein n=1 Tax=Pandoravirus dulcis TaxID=1349409 RepID=S4VVG9_9VIRU|nr:hypothetical protein pdul_cds_162 [Pandoravirus dulcis]AGO82086.2 hypothetical protein pdul_cds_162 [Pandoravirus dulcis]
MRPNAFIRMGTHRTHTPTPVCLPRIALIVCATLARTSAYAARPIACGSYSTGDSRPKPWPMCATTLAACASSSPSRATATRSYRTLPLVMYPLCSLWVPHLRANGP